jgi:hypothetical protein
VPACAGDRIGGVIAFRSNGFDVLRRVRRRDPASRTSNELNPTQRKSDGNGGWLTAARTVG